MIEPEFLMDVNETNPDTGFLCHYVKSDTEYFGLHTHNYYELFLTLDGNITHIINGSTHHLHKNQLLFVRDTDVHTYKSADGKYITGWYKLNNIWYYLDTSGMKTGWIKPDNNWYY